LITDILWLQTLSSIIADLEAASIDYTLLNRSALFVQEVAVPQPQILDIVLQWDLFERAHALFAVESLIERDGHKAHFSFERNQIKISFLCYYNTVIVTDPDCLPVFYKGQHIWVKALDYFTRTLSSDDPLFATVKAHLRALQEHNSQLNELAWNQDAYDAWVRRFGTPQEAVSTRSQTAKSTTSACPKPLHSSSKNLLEFSRLQGYYSLQPVMT
jgi:hypothetical protein